MKILSTIHFNDAEIEKILASAPDIDYFYLSGKDLFDALDILADVDVLYTFQAIPDPVETPQLAWVQLHSAGADHILATPLYRDTEIRITTMNGIHATPIAEYVLAMMLYFNRQFPQIEADKDQKVWPENAWDRYSAKELRESTLGIVGYGSIGREIARLARAFEMEVLAIKRDLRDLSDHAFIFPGLGDPEGNLPERIYPPEGLPSFLSACDYVVITAPLTAETRGLFSGSAFSAMKPDSVLINVARGQIVDETALQHALSEGVIRGAALDVFAEEPLPQDSPLWDLPNLIITPHISGVTTHYNERAVEIFAENIRRFANGENLINLVSRELDY